MKHVQISHCICREYTIYLHYREAGADIALRTGGSGIGLRTGSRKHNKGVVAPGMPNFQYFLDFQSGFAETVNTPFCEYLIDRGTFKGAKKLKHLYSFLLRESAKKVPPLVVRPLRGGKALVAGPLMEELFLRLP